MEDVVPSHHRSREMVPERLSARRHFGLMAGDVLATISPRDKRSRTRRFLEYRVAAQAWVDGVAATIEIPHAILANPLGSRADRATFTLRGDGRAGQKGKPGVGSKVLVQCINGDPNNAVIVSGYRADGDADPEPAREGDLALLWEYNGVRVAVGPLGEVRLTRRGPTRADGTLDGDRVPADQVGAFVELGAAGGIVVATTRPDGDAVKIETSLVLDHAASTLAVTTRAGLAISVVDGPVTVRAKGDVTVTSDEGAVTATATRGDVTLAAPRGKVRLGRNASQKAVQGDRLAKFLKDVLQAIQQITATNGAGPTSPPLNAAVFAQLAGQVEDLLSTAVDVAPAP